MAETKETSDGPDCECGHGLYWHYMCGLPQESRCLTDDGCRQFTPERKGSVVPVAAKQDQYKWMYEHHRKTADSYAERSHETAGDLSEGYSALSEAHHAFAMVCGKLAEIDLSAHEGEM